MEGGGVETCLDLDGRGLGFNLGIVTVELGED